MDGMKEDVGSRYRVLKIVFFAQFTATHPLHVGEQLI